MPFHRGCYLKHPTTGADGLWIELSTDPPGVLTGGPRTSWPAVVTSGGQKDTAASYGVKVSNWINGLCTKVFGVVTTKVVVVTVTFSSLSPLTLDPNLSVQVAEGDCQAFKVR